MKNVILYSRWGYFDGFLLILFTYKISPTDRFLIYRRTIKRKRSKCTISIQNSQLIFEHLNEKTGQRIAKISVDCDKMNQIIICASWNKKVNLLSVLINEDLFFNTTAEDQPYKVRFDIHGIPTIIHKDVIVFREMSDEGEITRQSAIESWDAIQHEVNILLDGTQGNSNHIFCLEIYKNCITKLVTGLEVYLKNRFMELEELIPANYDELLKFVREGKRLQLKKEIINHIPTKDVLRNIVSTNREFNFQDGKKSRDLFGQIYGIIFDDIPEIDAQKVARINEILLIRHRISHTDKVSGILNDYEAWRKKPIILDVQYVNQLRSDFNFFITRLEKYSETKIKDECLFNV